MPNLSRFLVIVALLAAPTFAQQPRKLGEIKVEVDANRIPVRITASSTELQNLADVAFESHGRYKRVASGQAFDFKFTAVTATQVRVDITKGAAGAPVSSDVANGTTWRNALLRAADIAVQKTNGMNLRGIFTARLAFVSQRNGKGDIYESDLFLNEGRRLTHDNALTLTPRWSPDGSRIIYTSFRKRAPDLYMLDPVSGRNSEFASFRGTNSGARFSPSGQQIAMVLTAEGTPEIYVSSANGRANPVRKTRSDAVKSSPCWSPDGSQIVFAMDPGPQLYVMSVNGGAPQRLSVGSGYAAEPDWSRGNPNKIACTVREGSRYQIAVYDRSTGTGKVVSKAAFDGIEPSWLADGRHLIYTARDRSSSVLCILDTETGKSTPIQTDVPVQQAGVWLGP